MVRKTEDIWGIHLKIQIRKIFCLNQELEAPVLCSQTWANWVRCFPSVAATCRRHVSWDRCIRATCPISVPLMYQNTHMCREEQSCCWRISYCCSIYSPTSATGCTTNPRVWVRQRRRILCLHKERANNHNNGFDYLYSTSDYLEINLLRKDKTKKWKVLLCTLKTNN